MRVINRRTVLTTATSAMAITYIAQDALSAAPEMQKVILDMFGNRPIIEGRVTLNVPPISENGYSVSIEVEADSPMTDTDHVRHITIFSDRNPVPLIARYNFSPASGRARAASRIRLAGTQSIFAIAEMSDGRLFQKSVKTIVTVAACVIL